MSGIESELAKAFIGGALAMLLMFIVAVMLVRLFTERHHDDVDKSKCAERPYYISRERSFAKEGKRGKARKPNNEHGRGAGGA